MLLFYNIRHYRNHLLGMVCDSVSHFRYEAKTYDVWIIELFEMSMFVNPRDSDMYHERGSFSTDGQLKPVTILLVKNINSLL